MNTGKPCSLSSWSGPDGLLSRGSSTRYARRSQGPVRFPAPSNTGPWPSLQLTYRVEGSRERHRRPRPLGTHRNSITWAFRQPVRRSTLNRCQRKARLAYPCGVAAQPACLAPRRGRCTSTKNFRTLTTYRLALDFDDPSSVYLSNLSVGALPHHQGGGEAECTRCSTAGQHSEFYPHLGWQAARRSCPRYALAGSRTPSTNVDRGYVDFARLYVLHQAGAFFVTRAKSNIAHRV